MAHVWLTNAVGEWGIHPLAGECCLVAAEEGEARFEPPASRIDQPHLWFVPEGTAGGPVSWALLASPNARPLLNGLALRLGMRLLRDRDQISVGGRHYFFSSEELARVVPFPGLAQPAHCPRCKRIIEPGDAAVACPQCRAWHHQSKFPCWTYEGTCALCQRQPTALDTGFAWTPENL